MKEMRKQPVTSSLPPNILKNINNSTTQYKNEITTNNNF